jgi:hypothetical protein
VASCSLLSFQQDQFIKAVTIIIRSIGFSYKLLSNFETLGTRLDFVTFINQCYYSIMISLEALAMLDSSNFIIAKAEEGYFVATI